MTTTSSSMFSTRARPVPLPGWLQAMTRAEMPDPVNKHPVVPEQIAVRKANRRTLRFLRTTSCRTIAEVGIFKRYTSMEIAKHLAGQGELYLFDFSDRVEHVVSELRAAGYHNVVGHENSRKLLDSYNWSLMHLLKQHEAPAFDYVFLDGAHTWGVDALFGISERRTLTQQKFAGLGALESR